ncbi:MAG: hypothetical protein G01um1014106_523, partial [Parcubacteria group bacterium Gr01-1014_106]
MDFPTLDARLRRLLSVCVVVGGLLAALFVLFAPSLPRWGERHTPHLQPRPLILSSGRTVAQTVRWEGTPLDTVVFWLDTATPRPNEGALHLTIETDNGVTEHTLAFADIPPSGTAVFSLPEPLRVRQGTYGTLRLRAPDIERVALAWQIDSTRYAAGELTRPNGVTQGDLAFQLRYQRPALGDMPRQAAAVVMLAVAGIFVGVLLRRPSSVLFGSTGVSRRDVWIIGAIALAVFGWYAVHLLRPGIWVGPTDFSKDAAYLATAASAVQNGAWPVWSHLTCGGMAALGNPEGNTISLGTLFATLLPPDRALLLLLAGEAMLSAVGTFLLARALGVSLIGSVIATLIASLSGAFAYRITEGFTQVGGAVAFAPWVLLGVVQALKTRSVWWVLLSGTALAAVFLRGDVHVIVGLVMLVALWLLLSCVQTRSRWPLIILAGIGAVAFLWGSIKLLPYLEQPALIGGELHPYVTPLAQFGLLDDALLRVHDHSFTVRPLHGQYPERWGNFGAYVGILPIVLAGIGIFTRRRHRVLLLLLTIAAFALSEGALFEYVLRHNDLASVLLRVPSRLLSLFVMFLGIFAGIGFDRMRRDFPRVSGRFLGALVLAVLLFDLGLATRGIFTRSTEWSTAPLPAVMEAPVLIPHANISPNDERHPTTMLRAGFSLPRMCGDQNNPPAFIRDLREPRPLASIPSRIAPNRVVLAMPAGPSDQTVYERFTTSWTPPEHVMLLESPEGAL